MPYTDRFSLFNRLHHILLRGLFIFTEPAKVGLAVCHSNDYDGPTTTKPSVGGLIVRR